MYVFIRVLMATEDLQYTTYYDLFIFLSCLNLDSTCQNNSFSTEERTGLEQFEVD